MWTYRYSGLFLNDVKKDAANNQYYLCGQNSSSEAVFMVLDASGNIVISKKFTIAQADRSYFSRIIKASDGGYVAVGYVTGHDPDGAGAEIKFNQITYTDNNGDSQTDHISSPLIVKLDASGNHVWHRVFRYYTAATKNPSTERIYNDASFNDVVEVSDGYVAVGSYDVNQHRSATNSDGDDATPNDALIVKTTTAGAVTYHKQVDNPNTSTSQSSKYLTAVNTTSAGAIIAAGMDDSRELIQKFAGSGGFSNTFSRIFRYSQSFFVNDPTDVSQIYEVPGSTDLVTMAMYIKPLSFFSNAIHRVNSTATSNVWSKRYDFTGFFTILPRGSLTSDNGYICASMGAGGGSNYDFHVIKTDNNGDTPITGCPANSFTPTAQAGPTTFADPHYNSWSSGTPGANSTTITRTTISLSPLFVCTKIACTPPAAATTVTATPSTICQGQSSTITASGPATGVTYNVYTTPTGGSSLGSTPLSVSPSTTTTYYIETALNSDASCVSTSRTSVTVTVNPNPVPTISAGGPTTFCQGGSVILTASSTQPISGYSWSNGATTSSITVTTSGSYTVTVTHTNGCSNNSAATTVTVNSSPTPTITPSGSTTFCQGDSVTLTSSAATSYSWSTGATTQSITVNTSGSYTVTVTSGGCSGSSSPVTVTVNPNPAPNVTAGGPTTICQGDSVSLTSDIANSYSWNTGATTQTIYATTNGSYVVTVTYSNGCSNTSAPTNVTINGNSPPNITSSGSTTFCQGDSVTLTSDAADSYNWSTGATTQSITVYASGTFTVTATYANGCSSTSSSTTVIVNNNPVPDMSGPNSVCSGTTGSTYTVNFNPSNTYNWTVTGNGVLTSGQGTGTITVDFDSSGSATVIVSENSAAGCVGIDSINVTISSGLNPVISVTGDTVFCQGDSVLLDAGSGYTTYTWSNGNTSQVITVKDSGSYSVTVTDSGGCSGTSSSSVNVIVNGNPNPVVSASGSTNICSGDSVILDAGNGYVSYSWSNGSTVQTITVDSSGNFYVTVTDANGCSGSNSSPVNITVNQSPNPIIAPSGSTTICQGQTVSLNAGSGYVSYSWNTGATTQSITVDTSGTYSVTVTDNNGCTNDSASAEQTVTVNPLPTAAIAGSDTICKGNNTVLTASGGSSYSWSNGASTGSITISPSASTNYTVTVTDTNSCTNTANHFLFVRIVPVSLTGNNIICVGDSTQLSASGGVSYLWSTGATTNSIFASPASSSSYSVVVSDGVCVDSASMNITVLPVPVANISSSDSVICSGNQGTLTATGGGTYLWNTGDTTSVISVSPSSTVTYSVTVSNGVCDAEDSLVVLVSQGPTATIDAGNDTIINLFDNAQLNGVGGVTYSWSPSSGLSCTDCPNPTANPEETTLYYLVATDSLGCPATDSVLVTVRIPDSEVFVPNIFSPNGDGSNDILYVYGRYIKEMELIIFDRWGEKIFESRSTASGWDGTYKGKALNTAVFAYILKYTLVNETESLTKQGNITLLR
jgi:large repetitive protein